MEPNFEALQKDLYQRLDDAPLEPGAKFYEPIYQGPNVEDPVKLMSRRIRFSDVESIQMFSGFRGSGKTTELFRLRKDLESQGYVVLYGDALKYLNPSQEIDISDLLLVLAGTFSDALESSEFVPIGKDSYWERFVHFLNNTEVDVTELGLKGDALAMSADLKLSLQTAPTFRQKLQKRLVNSIGELKRNVDKFFEDGVKVIQETGGPELKGIVFLFDQLEQIRGSKFNEQDVIQSVQRLFANHADELKIPYMHMVYTVPPWLKFALPNTVDITTMLPCVHLWHNDEERTPSNDGWKSLCSIVYKRFGEEGYKYFFSGEDAEHPLAKKLIAVCGGHFRDLLRLLRESVLRTEKFPVTEAQIDNAINSVRGNFLPIAIDDAIWLDKIGRIRDAVLPNTDAENINRLTRFLDTHFVLYFVNGTQWYDIHPLIRDEVAGIVAREAALKAQYIQKAS